MINLRRKENDLINIDLRLLELIPEIGADAFAVLCVIADKTNKNNVAFLTKSFLEKETGFGRDKLAKAIQLLEKNKLITVTRNYGERGFSFSAISYINKAEGGKC